MPGPAAARERYDLSSLQVVVHGAAPCPVSVKRAMIEWWGPIIHEYYAGTEDIGNTATTSAEWLAHPGSVGRPAVECHIIGADGRELAAGEAGLVYFAGGRPFTYHNDAGKTEAITNANGKCPRSVEPNGKLYKRRLRERYWAGHTFFDCVSFDCVSADYLT